MRHGSISPDAAERYERRLTIAGALIEDDDPEIQRIDREMAAEEERFRRETALKEDQFRRRMHALTARASAME